MFETNDPLTHEEIDAVKQNATDRLDVWRRRGIYATAAFLASCLFLYLFLEGSPLHAYWQLFGKYLLLISMMLLLIFVYCVGLWWAAWYARRHAEKLAESSITTEGNPNSGSRL
jgi:hypothetical protein